jgi:hypothetical protein
VRAIFSKTIMDKLAPPSPLPGDRDWDIAFTRLSREVLPQLEAGVQRLSRRFQALGLLCDVQMRHTPRGLSTFLAVMGQRGLLFIVDVTMIDGMVVAGCPGAALDVRMMDAFGDVAMQCRAATAPGARPYSARSEEILAAADLARCATTIFVMAMRYFDLAPSVEGGCAR